MSFRHLGYRALSCIAPLLLTAAVAGCGSSGDADAAAAAGQADSAAAAVVVPDSAQADSTADLPDSVPVEIAYARRGDISSFLVFSSTIETEEAVEIHPEITGQVDAVLAEEGDQVQAGQILVRLDDEQARIDSRESQVELEYLEGGYKRTEEMYRRGLISTQEHEDKLYELAQARLRRQKARLALDHTRIRAPFAGVLTSRLAHLGARVAPGDKLFDLVKLDDLITRVHVPGQYLRDVALRQPAQIESDFLPDMVFEGYVKRISPVVDPKSGTFKVTLGVRDRWEHLRPGIFVTVRIITATHADAVLVPKEAIVYDGGDRFVFVVDRDTAQRVHLDAGFENSRFVEALHAIGDSTRIIVVGQNGLKDQTRVRIVSSAAAVPAVSEPAAAVSQG